jgi:hypothetical protein
MAVSFEAFLLGITDHILDVVWSEPLLWRHVRVEDHFNIWRISTTF